MLGMEVISTHEQIDLAKEGEITPKEEDVELTLV